MDDTLSPATGADLVKLRKSKGVLQKHVARKLGITRGSLNGWESLPEIDELRAARYGKAVDELFREALA